MCNFRAIFCRFSGDFSAQFARNFSAYSAHVLHKFCANFAFFPAIFIQGLSSSSRLTWMFVAPQSGKTQVAVGEVLPSSALSPSRSVDSQLNNLSMSVSTPVSQHHVYVPYYSSVGTLLLSLMIRLGITYVCCRSSLSTVLDPVQVV